jgi:hypothetical protein
MAWTDLEWQLGGGQSLNFPADLVDEVMFKWLEGAVN